MSMKFNNNILYLTKIEFVLVTKALAGALSRRDKKKNGFEGVFNEVKEARKLGVKLLEQRIQCLETEADVSDLAMEQAIALLDDGEGEE